MLLKGIMTEQVEGKKHELHTVKKKQIKIKILLVLMRINTVYIEVNSQYPSFTLCLMFSVL